MPSMCRTTLRVVLPGRFVPEMMRSIWRSFRDSGSTGTHDIDREEARIRSILAPDRHALSQQPAHFLANRVAEEADLGAAGGQRRVEQRTGAVVADLVVFQGEQLQRI